MKINPVGFGNHDNIYFTCKIQKVKFKLIGFFETGDLYILSSKKIKEIPDFNQNFVYNKIKESFEEWDFHLKTPYNKILKHNFKTYNNLKNYIK